ncbi:MAG: long-chain fatty acid--CoA ligase [Candidatus Sericytochromatia bacterium]
MSNYIIPSVFFETVAKQPGKRALGSKINGQWQYLNYGEVAQKVRQMAAALLELGVQPRDRVAIMSENSPQWVISDLGIMSAGALDVPVYPTLTHEQLEFILNDCGARGIVVSNNTHYQKVMRIWEQVPSLEFIVFVDPVSEDSACKVRTLSFEALLAQGEAQLDKHLPGIETRIQGTQPEDLCSIIYTSGTTGNPKGVMLMHKNFMSNAQECAKILVEPHEEILELSFLPLSHVFERVVYYALVVVSGGTVAYAESFDTISANLQEIKPTVLASVPRVYEKIHARVMDQVQASPKMRQRIFAWALQVGEAWFHANQAGKVPAALALKHTIATKLVLGKIQARTGGRLQVLLSGGAPLMKELAVFFAAVGLPILEGYGLTESSPVICVGRKGKITFGAIGPPIPGVEVKIASDGEILARGPNIMKGYYNNPEATAETISPDGWLHTGDIGELDSNGYLRITDRKKEIIVMSNGKNVAPQPIESLLKTSSYIEQIVLIGDNRKYISALIVPAFEALKARTRELGIAELGPEALCQHEKVHALFRSEINRLSESRLARFEEVKQFRLLPAEFTIENNEITPKLSLRRKIIAQRYADLIEAMYAGEPTKKI